MGKTMPHAGWQTASLLEAPAPSASLRTATNAPDTSGLLAPRKKDNNKRGGGAKSTKDRRDGKRNR